MKLKLYYKCFIILLKSIFNTLRSPYTLFKYINCKYVQFFSYNKLEYKKSEKIIIFFIPGSQDVSGGVLQIYNLLKLTREYFKSSNVDALICWYPGEFITQYKFQGFENDIIVYNFNAVLKNISKECELFFHIPEIAVNRMINKIGWINLEALKERNKLNINILNQNIDLMPDANVIKKIKNVFPFLTCTVGNPVWATLSERERLGIPIHVLPTWYYPDDAKWQSFDTKKELLIVSPDACDYKKLILDKMRSEIPSLVIREIKNMKYEEYLYFERNAKWSLTFGEGLDGYFYGPVLRGAIAFAVRNNTFDNPGMESLETVYDTYDEMYERITSDIKRLNNKTLYEEYNHKVRSPIADIVSYDNTNKALISYYKGEFTFS